MPRLTFPFVADGLLVPALVGLAAPAMQALRAQGSPLPGSIWAKGMVDSGTTITAVVPRLLTALNAAPGPGTQTQTASGSAGVHFYRISFTIYNLSAGGTVLSRMNWLVINVVNDLDDIDILFGLDLLREIVLTVDGPSGQFALDF
jgi:Aspartyl protease